MRASDGHHHLSSSNIVTFEKLSLLFGGTDDTGVVRGSEVVGARRDRYRHHIQRRGTPIRAARHARRLVEHKLMPADVDPAGNLTDRFDDGFHHKTSFPGWSLPGSNGFESGLVEPFCRTSAPTRWRREVDVADPHRTLGHLWRRSRSRLASLHRLQNRCLPHLGEPVRLGPLRSAVRATPVALSAQVVRRRGRTTHALREPLRNGEPGSRRQRSKPASPMH